jgi:hypothetical protein
MLPRILRGGKKCATKSIKPGAAFCQTGISELAIALVASTARGIND